MFEKSSGMKRHHLRASTAWACACLCWLLAAPAALATEVLLVRDLDGVRDELGFKMDLPSPLTLARNGKFSDEYGRTYGWIRWEEDMFGPDPVAATRCDALITAKEKTLVLVDKQQAERGCTLSFRKKGTPAEYVTLQSFWLPEERCRPGSAFNFQCFLEVETVSDSPISKGFAANVARQMTAIAGNPALTTFEEWRRETTKR
ncbi:hypothetical protein [uncultured Bradyrhizobium sp.]|jgi:hypothetical protein|uniref:hypothetical protein n=1 Tax=uncultured Bradyrhizobium sp. TaxID=199684 RepID=UPI002618AF78|nr:hypothetical protein [uncultured Bradyrhizobium sp.]